MVRRGCKKWTRERERSEDDERGDMEKTQLRASAGRVGVVLIYNPPSRTPRTSSTARRSSRNGHISVSSVSCGSLNHDETGTALFGWKMYDAGELSRMIVPSIGRPSCDKSYTQRPLRNHGKDLTTGVDVP